MKLLGDKVLIRKYSVTEVDETSGLAWNSDGDSLPRAEVISVSDELVMGVVGNGVTIPEVGDHVYYVEPREKGKVKYQDETHYIVPLSALVAII